MVFGEGLSLRAEAMKLAVQGEFFKETSANEGNTYAVFRAEVGAEGHQRTVDREPKEHDNEHSTC